MKGHIHIRCATRSRKRPVSAFSSPLEGSTASAGAARQVVRQWLDDEGHGDLHATAELITSELVTNAVVHGAEPIRLSLICCDDVVRVEVFDSSPTLARRGAVAAREIGGWGLQIVESLSLEWGSDHVDDGKVTWARIRTSADRSIDGADPSVI